MSTHDTYLVGIWLISSSLGQAWQPLLSSSWHPLDLQAPVEGVWTNAAHTCILSLRYLLHTYLLGLHFILFMF
jgi:hypothetical protein